MRRFPPPWWAGWRRAERVRGHGIGELLLADAIRRTLSASQSVAVYAILVDAKDEHASTFYQRFGFRQFPLNGNRLFLLAETATRALGAD